MSSQDTPSEGTGTQSPGSSATSQPAESVTARPSTSRGHCVPTHQRQYNVW